jgi:triphosphoribosyl-dephospho-CoA synthase
MGAPHLSVGGRIYEAVKRTHDAIGCNTNLGIVLLCAPLAAAAMQAADHPLRDSLANVLAHLDIADAEDAFAAIRLAQPAGLGESATHDVREPARVTLREAMDVARGRDAIAQQYASDYRDVFELGVQRLKTGLMRWHDIRWATTFAYMGFLAAFDDSHIARKFGGSCAQQVRHQARIIDATLLEYASPESIAPALLDFDATLKAQGLNPGTSADLTVASLFAHGLQMTQHAQSRA